MNIKELMNGNIKEIRTIQNDKCPHLYADDQYTGKCQISGGTTQSGYDFERYCKSASNWQYCPNYEGRVR